MAPGDTPPPGTRVRSHGNDEDRRGRAGPSGGESATPASAGPPAAEGPGRGGQSRSRRGCSGRAWSHNAAPHKSGCHRTSGSCVCCQATLGCCSSLPWPPLSLLRRRWGVATHDDTRTCRTGEVGSHGRHLPPGCVDVAPLQGSNEQPGNPDHGQHRRWAGRTVVSWPVLRQATTGTSLRWPRTGSADWTPMRDLPYVRRRIGGTALGCSPEEVGSGAWMAIPIALVAKLPGQREPHLGVGGLDL